MARLTFIRGGSGLARRVSQTQPTAGDAGSITVLNGHSQGGGLRDPDGAFSIKWAASGRFVYRIGRDSVDLGDERALILNSGQPYELEFPEGRWSETLCVFFSDDLVRGVWEGLHDPDGGLDGPSIASAPPFPEVAFSLTPAVRLRLASLRASFDAADPATTVGEAHLLALLEAVLGVGRQHRLHTDRLPALKLSTRRALLARMLKARELIEDSPTEAPTLSDLAREVGLSKFHLLRLFKAAFGCTPGAYAQARRMERAADLLQSTGASLESVAGKLGYDSAASLVRAFRRHSGRTPGAYRREIRNLG